MLGMSIGCSQRSCHISPLIFQQSADRKIHLSPWFSVQMGFKHRQLLEILAPDQSDGQTCIDTCYHYCSVSCLQESATVYPPSSANFPLPPPPPPPLYEINQTSRQAMIATGSLLLTVVLAFVYYAFCNEDSRNAMNRTSLGGGQEQREDNSEDGVTHPAWLIETVGLQKEIINRIAVYKYTKNEVVQGRDCSVCLVDFEEGETLRLLPNCHHSFHIQCIDTWLRSHTNCPLCRSAIALDSNMNPTLAHNMESSSDHGRMHQRDLNDSGRNMVALQSSGDFMQAVSYDMVLRDPSETSTMRDSTPELQLKLPTPV